MTDETLVVERCSPVRSGMSGIPAAGPFPSLLEPTGQLVWALTSTTSLEAIVGDIERVMRRVAPLILANGYSRREEGLGADVEVWDTAHSTMSKPQAVRAERA